MAAHFNPIPSLSPENRFSFTCPVFGATTEIRACFQLRDLLWAGKKQEVRRGCQACLHDSKCPIVPIMREMIRTGDEPGYFAREPRSGSLKERHLNAIQNVIVLDTTMDNFGVSTAERTAIVATNGAHARLKGAPGVIASVKSPVRRSKPAEHLIEAAKSGDLAVAVTEATKGAAA